MRYLFLSLLLLFSLRMFAQVNEGLSPEERAYLFHVVKKSPILNSNFGRYFDYRGPEIRFPNNTLNYDSIELLIINQPDLLLIRKSEIAKSTKGLIAEAANKMALWELNKVLHAKRSASDELAQYANEYATFERLLLERLPPAALKEKSESPAPHPKLYQVMNPALTFNDRNAMLESMRFLDLNDCMVTHRAIDYAINSYIEKRAYEICRNLGGTADTFKNVLVAAGDGSNTSGLLDEREKDEKGRWNKGLPKAVGLFPYQVTIERSEDKKKVTQKIVPMRYTENQFETVGKHRHTNVHFDVWGYNSEKQTTVVLEKNGLNYHLFGSNETRFLSPDSSFSGGKTFQAIINELEHKEIAKLYEMIYGKRGFDYWIEYNGKKKDAVELKIEKNEKEYSDMGYSPITTNAKPSGSVKRAKKKAQRSGAGTFDGAPTTNSNRKERKALQQTIVDLYNQFEAYKRKIEELKKQKEEAIDLMNVYKRRLDLYKGLMGHRWASYVEEDGLYTFEDSSTFDIRTQEFQFKPTAEPEAFEVRLIAVPMSALSDNADEVMLHMNMIDAEPNYNARINLDLTDVFESDKWHLDKQLFQDKDSVAVRVFLEELLNKKIDFQIVARGNGIGAWNGSQVIKAENPVELTRYPGDSGQGKMDSTFVRLRRSEVLVHIDRAILLEINSFTDPVKSNIDLSNPVFNEAMSKYKLTKNDILSAYRTATLLKQVKGELNVLAGNYLNREQARVVIDRLNKEMDKVRISVGMTSFKQSDF